jgi:hypothetical protein
LSLAEDHETLGALPDQMLQLPCAKGAAAPKDEQGLQETGLTRRVIARNQGKPRIELKF